MALVEEAAAQARQQVRQAAVIAREAEAERLAGVELRVPESRLNRHRPLKRVKRLLHAAAVPEHDAAPRVRLGPLGVGAQRLIHPAERLFQPPGGPGLLSLVQT